jgi:hypothetical protein
MQISLARHAHTRSGDKGATRNPGVIAYHPGHYPALLREFGAQRCGELVQQQVERFEFPNPGALNFLPHQTLGGAAVSLRTVTQGKPLAAALMDLQNRRSQINGTHE